MRSRYRVHDSSLPHFVTCTILEWLPVFTTGSMCDLLVESLRFCQQEKDLKIPAWVILDNHFHAILGAPDLGNVLGQLKRFTAARILEELRSQLREWLLNQLHFYCARHKTLSEHQVWQEGSHPQSIRSDQVMQQKRDYIHLNSVRRGLVSLPEHWRYSSAHGWLGEAKPVLFCDPWK
jgi:REP element-mobilizing transposase RayT